MSVADRSEIEYSERSELVKIPDAPSQRNPSPREMKNLDKNTQVEEGGATAKTHSTTETARVKYQQFKNKKILCCKAPIFVAVVAAVLIAFVVGMSVSAVYKTGIFAPKGDDEWLNPDCKYYARYNTSTELWNIAYYSYGYVDVFDPDLNETVSKLQRGIFVEFEFKNGTKVRQRFHLKGFNWSGFETKLNLFDGLKDQTPDKVFDFLAQQGFNAIRIPFHLAIVNPLTKPAYKNQYTTNMKLVGATSLNALETMIMIAAQKGMLVLLDLHSFGPGTGNKDGLWYNSEYNEWNVTQGWLAVVNRVKKYWNVIGADIRNEMYNGTWGGYDYITDIKGLQERVGREILKAAPGWLVVVEGTFKSPESATETFAAENFIGVADWPFNYSITPGLKDKFVYSPHVFGPSMANFGYFERDEFAQYLPAIWRSHWGYIKDADMGTIMLGAWGCQVSEDNVTQAAYDSWSAALAQYLNDIDSRDAFYWAVNPNLYGVAGLLQDDWVTPNQITLDWAAAVQPKPSLLTYYQRRANFCLRQ